MAYTDILFDLDGTLNESGPGIIRSFFQTMDKLGKPLEDDCDLGFVVGPPLSYSFRELGVEEKIDEAVRIYREFYSSEGIFNCVIYDGIPELLKTLKDKGKHLHIATSKAEIMARRVLEHFDLMKYFDVIAAATLDDSRSTKPQVVAYILELLGDVSKENIVMVGDRYHDINGAAENGLDSVGVTYGYGSRAELENAGATYIAQTPAEILKYI